MADAGLTLTQIREIRDRKKQLSDQIPKAVIKAAVAAALEGGMSEQEVATELGMTRQQVNQSYIDRPEQ